MFTRNQDRAIEKIGERDVDLYDKNTFYKCMMYIKNTFF